MFKNPEAFVRGLAGTFVLIGVLLAWLVSPWWLLLPTFVAINLLQSAFTGFCPAAIFFKWAESSAHRSRPADLAARIRSGQTVLIDVRESGEWSEGVAENAVCLPLSDLRGSRERWRSFLAEKRDAELAVYCASGMRSGAAARILRAEGYRAVNSGGLRDWRAAGWPITTAKG